MGPLLWAPVLMIWPPSHIHLRPPAPAHRASSTKSVPLFLRDSLQAKTKSTLFMDNSPGRCEDHDRQARFAAAVCTVMPVLTRRSCTEVASQIIGTWGRLPPRNIHSFRSSVRITVVLLKIYSFTLRPIKQSRISFKL
jgi:hypothetical protein